MATMVTERTYTYPPGPRGFPVFGNLIPRFPANHARTLRRRQRKYRHATQMPATPPTVLSTIPHIENRPACQSVGTQPPIVEPRNIPTQIARRLTAAVRR